MNPSGMAQFLLMLFIVLAKWSSADQTADQC